VAIRDSLVLTDDQRALRDLVRGFLADQLASDSLRAMINAEPGYSPELHARLATGLGLAGPRFGCGLGLCGACMVIIDGRARSSCDYPAWAAEGTSVTTVEGLRKDGALHAVQQAFLAEQAAQCGYCTSGMVIAAAALLAANPAPTEQEVRAALDGNLCRCGAYPNIVAAIREAAGREGG